MNRELDYYYENEMQHFNFLKMPKFLFDDERFKSLSNDAKLLYSLMLDRLNLSIQNKWVDKDNKVYIYYTINNMIGNLNCAKDKVLKIISELDESGVGLIEKKRQGLGKPDIIYIKKVSTENKQSSSEQPEDKQPSDEQTEKKQMENEQQEVCKPDNSTEFGKTDFKSSEKSTSRSRENRLQEFGKTDPNNNNINNTYRSDNLINHIQENEQIDKIDKIDNTDTYLQIIKDNIEYDHYMQQANDTEKEQYEELFQIITDVVCVNRKTVRVSGEQYPYALVKARFLKLKSSHLQYVIGCMKKTTTKISNIKSYLITALYNALSTMSHYYQQAVQHDIGIENKNNDKPVNNSSKNISPITIITKNIRAIT